MGKKDFDDYIKSKEEKHEQNKIDWNKQREEWIEYLNLLYQNVENWIQEYVDSGRIKITHSDKQITEEHIGTYTVKRVELEIDNTIIILDPKGTLLIGAKGRVDLIGPKGKIMFVLANKHSTDPKIDLKIFTSDEEKEEYERIEKEKKKVEIEWSWKIATRYPNTSYSELDENAFFDCIMETING